MSKEANPFKAGSRKAKIYDAFKAAKDPDAGLDAANAIAKKEGIKPGTVRSWVSSWTKGGIKPKPKEKADKPDKPVKEKKAPTLKAISKKDNEFHPLFKYSNRARADQAHEELCTRAGLRPHAFHVIENDGKFAVAPANYKPGGPMPQFQNGDIVYDALIINSKAKVLQAGSEQSVVRYVKERQHGPREDCVINRYLIKLPDDKPKRERLEKTDNKKLQRAANDSKAFNLIPNIKGKVKREKL